METTIVNPKEFGIEETRANELIGEMLPQIRSEREEMIKQFDEVVKLNVEDAKTWKQARELRLIIQKNRTKGINVWHKGAKDFFLQGGKFVDAIKRREVSINERMEETLLEIEKHEEIQRKKEVDALNEKRISELEKYSEYVPFGINLGELPEEQYQKVFNGSKMQFEAEQARLKAEEVEQERLAKIEKLYNDRKESLLDLWKFIENKTANFGELTDEEFRQIKSNAEKSKKENEAEQERIKKENARLEKERKAAELKAEKERKEREAQEREKEAEREKERLAIEKERKAFEAEKERLAKIESDRLAKIETERKAKEAEEKAEAHRLSELKKAPIKKQLQIWVNAFEIPKTEIDNEVSNEIKTKFEAFKKWSVSKIENI